MVERLKDYLTAQSEPSVPAVDEVGDGVMHTEGGRVQVSTDFHVVSSHQPNGRLVLVVKDLPLERGAQQQHEVVWKGRGETLAKAAQQPHRQRPDKRQTFHRCHLQMRNDELGLVLKSGTYSHFTTLESVVESGNLQG